MTGQKSAPIILLGSARSGTTLFQRLLNSYDDVIIWGEHAGFLKPLADSYFLVRHSNSMFEFSYPQAQGNNIPLDIYKDPKQWQAWNNWFKPDDITDQYRDFINRVFLPGWHNQIFRWGFKEIRYGQDDRVIEFLKELFPATKVIVIYRNPLNVIDSQLSAFFRIGGRLAKLRKLLMLPKIVAMSWEWRRLNRNFIKYKAKDPNRIVIFSFERFIHDQQIRKSIFEQLDLSYSQRQESILDFEDGRGSAYQGTDLNQNRRWLKLGYIPASVVFLITYRTYLKMRKAFS